MPRRSMLSAAERESLLALPDTQNELIRRYTLSDSDLSVVRQRRGAANRLGFAVQLCYMRYPGIALGRGELPFPPMLHLVAAQLKIPVEKWAEYGDRSQTRREHMVELQTLFGFRSFTTSHHQAAVQDLAETALQTDTGIVLAGTVVEKLRAKAILLPRLNEFAQRLSLAPTATSTEC
jgi:TnpA family transposase